MKVKDLFTLIMNQSHIMDVLNSELFIVDEITGDGVPQQLAFAYSACDSDGTILVSAHPTNNYPELVY